jgi:hypothetical protein
MPGIPGTMLRIKHTVAEHCFVLFLQVMYGDNEIASPHFEAIRR